MQLGPQTSRLSMTATGQMTAVKDLVFVHRSVSHHLMSHGSLAGALVLVSRKHGIQIDALRE
jgi:hypothetical protein